MLKIDLNLSVFLMMVVVLVSERPSVDVQSGPDIVEHLKAATTVGVAVPASRRWRRRQRWETSSQAASAPNRPWSRRRLSRDAKDAAVLRSRLCRLPLDHLQICPQPR